MAKETFSDCLQSTCLMWFTVFKRLLWLLYGKWTKKDKREARKPFVSLLEGLAEYDGTLDKQASHGHGEKWMDSGIF